jgi:uncharacterized protein
MISLNITRQALRRRRVWCAAIVLAFGTLLFPLANRLTCHPGETVILLLPPVFGSLLWWGWPAVRRMPARQYVVYLVVMAAVLAAAEKLASYMAGGRLLWGEVFLALNFLIAWRLAWTVWSRTIGRAGEKYRRWGRRARRIAGGLGKISDPARRRKAALAMSIAPIRLGLVILVFAPLAFGSLIHRFKIGNPPDFGDFAALPIESVTFKTEDGLSISGWYLPERNCDSTVLICHGLGANKNNFAIFLTLFHGKGYNALIFDFRGHGESDGHTTTFGLCETADVRAAVDWLKKERPDASRHIFGLGSSMGAMALVRAAADDQRIEALILDSAYVSAPLMARQHLGRLPLVGPILGKLALASLSLHAGHSLWDLDASQAIARISPRPLFLIHGQDDFIIPPINQGLLFDLAKEPKTRWLAPGLHSNVMTADFDGYQRRVIEFLDGAKRRRP